MYAAHDENVFFPLGKNVRRSAAQPEKRHLWHFSGKQAEERAKRAISCRVVARVRRSEALAERYRAGCQSKWLLQICIEVCCLGFYNDLTREGYRQQAASSACLPEKCRRATLFWLHSASPNSAQVLPMAKPGGSSDLVFDEIKKPQATACEFFIWRRRGDSNSRAR